MRRREAVKYAAVLVAVFGTIICAAEFQDTGAAHPAPMTTHTLNPAGPPPGRDPAALERAREDARRAQQRVMDDNASPWLAP